MKNLPVTTVSSPLVQSLHEGAALCSTEVGEQIFLLGESKNFISKEVHVPSAFVLTDAFRALLLEEKGRKEKIKALVRQLNGASFSEQKKLLHTLQRMLLSIVLPSPIEKEINALYKKLGAKKNHKTLLKISSFIFVDHISFDHQPIEYVTVKKEQDLIVALKRSLASVFLPEVFLESEQKGCDSGFLKIAFLIEKAVPSQVHARVATFDPKTHFSGVLSLSASWGKEYKKKKIGEKDEFLVWKEDSQKTQISVIERTLGQKNFSFDVSNQGVWERTLVPIKEREQFCLTNQEVKILAEASCLVEQKYGPCSLLFEKRNNHFTLVSVQKVHCSTEQPHIEVYSLQKIGPVLAKGKGRGEKITTGKIRIIEKQSDVHSFQKGDIVVVKEEVLGLVQILPQASGVIISEHKVTSSVVQNARESGLPVVFLAPSSLKNLRNGKRVTLAFGVIYSGALPFEVKKEKISSHSKTKTQILVNIENPDNAFTLAQKNADGVGMIRFESLFLHEVPIHPLAVVQYPKIKDKKSKKEIDRLTKGFPDAKAYTIEKLASGLAKIAAAFYPAPVTVRLSDFKSSEFHTCIGVEEYKKGSPLQLFNHDASDQVTLQYRQAFALECLAMKKARDEWGLTNIIAMVPFCPTPEHGEEVLRQMNTQGLKSGTNGLQIYGRCEIPANFILAKEFIKIFDGFSLDTQGLEKNISSVSGGSASGWQEKNEGLSQAVIHQLVKDVIHVSHKNKKKVSYQSHGFVDSPEFAQFLVQQGIDSISFSPDEIREMKALTSGLERTVGRTGNRTHKGFLTLVVGFGVLAASLIGMGSGCSETLEQKIPEVKEVSEYLPPAKLREELEKNFQEKIDKFTQEKTVSYSESGFANFRLEYPVEWSMEHESESMTLTGVSSTEYMRLFVRSTTLLGDASTSTVQVAGKEAKQGHNVVLSDRVAPVLIEVPLANNKILTIEGGGEKFEKILSTIVLKE